MNAWEWTGDAFKETTGIALADRGFRFGMAFFESFPVRNGRAEHLAAHLMRLAAAADQVGWSVNRDGLARAGEQLIHLFAPDASLFTRLYLTAGPGILNDPATEPRLYLYAEPRKTTSPLAHDLITHPSPHVPLLGGLKTVNYWANLEAHAQAIHAGGTEALLFNPAGKLCSASMANIFLKLGDDWITPPLSTGARNGVIRERVLRAHPEIREQEVTAEELEGVTSAFLTSSWVGIAPVGSLNFRPLEWKIGEAPTLPS